MSDRAAVLGVIADRLGELRPGHPVRVGIDGLCGSGKSTFARELVGLLRERGHDAVHLESDGFHHLRAVRYRQGRDSARGYYEDAYDFEALADSVLRPLGPGGDRRYAVQVHDLATDAVLDRRAEAGPETIVVFDCTFLQRGPLRELWDEVIWLETDRAVALARGVARDEAAMGGRDAAIAAYESRYLAACDLYVAEETPRDRASLVVEHDDPAYPRLVEDGSRLGPIAPGSVESAP